MIRKHILAGVALLALAACGGAGGTAAPTTEADKLKMASEIATLMSDPKMVDSMMDSMKTSVAPMLDTACQGAPADALAACASAMQSARPAVMELLDESMEQTKAMMPDLMKEMGAIMARLYTGDELAAMHDFYSSPAGKSITAKQPQVMAEYMPVVMQRMQGMQMDMMGKMQDRLRKAMQDAGALPPAAPPT